MKYGVIAIGYNRPNLLTNLLNQLSKADYKNLDVSLIISLDKALNQECDKVADSYIWPHGQKIVVKAKERLGLKKHILQCGNYLNKYELDAVAVFEDDVFPEVSFFNYMIQAVDYYKDNDEIAGISLYRPSWNNVADRPFIPMKSKKGGGIFC